MFPPMSRPQTELIAACLKGDSVAWDELFDNFYQPTFRYVFQLSGDFSQEDAEEICQEAFLSVVKNLSTFQGNSSLQTWIFRIAGNRARDYIEKQNAAKRGGGEKPLSLHADDPHTGLSIDPPATLPTPDKALIKQESAAAISDCLQQLENPCREVIELRYFGDLSYEEIAAELKLNVKTVSSRLSKCMDKLEKIAAVHLGGRKQTNFPV